MLVDGDSGEESEATFIAFGHHVFVSHRVAAHEVIALNRGSRRCPADDAAAIQHGLKQALDRCVEVRIDQPPLTTSGEPDSLCCLDTGPQFGAGQIVAQAGVDLMHVGRSRRFQPAADRLFFRRFVTECVRDDDDRRIFASGRREELIDRFARRIAASHDDQRAGFDFGDRGHSSREVGLCTCDRRAAELHQIVLLTRDQGLNSCFASG